MISREFIENINLEYEKTREKNENIRQERLDVLYSKFPRIKSIDKDLSLHGIKVTRDIMKNPENSKNIINAFNDFFEQLNKEKAYLMTEENIPLNYLDIPYDCAICKDTGYIENSKRCKCFEQKIINHLYQMSNLNNIIKRENFSTFNIEIFSDIKNDKEPPQNENIQSILSSVESYIYNFDPKSGKNLLFYGPTGQGKTFFCNSIAKYLLDKGFLVIYQTSFKLIDIIERYRFKEKTRESVLNYNLLLNSDLLIIDDLGTEFNNSFTNAEIFNILNERLLKNRNTIISTNLSLIEIEKVYSKRVSSRIYGNYEIFKFHGPDVRWNKK